MSRRTIASALFVAGLLATTALAQPPKSDPASNDPSQPNKGKALDAFAKAMKEGIPLEGSVKGVKPTDKANGIVAAALANDPDVLIARAKVQLAEAELAKARQGVVLKVMTLNATIDEQKRAMASAEERYAWAERMVKTGNIPQGQLLDERAKLEAARAALAKAEMELKLLTGGKEAGVDAKSGHAPEQPVGTAIDWFLKVQAGEDSHRAVAQALIAGLDAYRSSHTPKGPIPERIRAALDRPVKLGPKGENITFEKAMEIFKKEAGLDMPVRGKFPQRMLNDPKSPPQTVTIISEGEELPVGAWFQMFEDNAVIPEFLRVGNGQGGTAEVERRRKKYQFYVRDYGLLISTKDSAPTDAPTLTQFWKQETASPQGRKPARAPEPGK